MFKFSWFDQQMLDGKVQDNNATYVEILELSLWTLLDSWILGAYLLYIFPKVELSQPELKKSFAFPFFLKNTC